MPDKKSEANHKIKIKTKALNLHYGAFHALGGGRMFTHALNTGEQAGSCFTDGITMDIRERSITAIIGPSGCGKSTLLRVFNRMNDLIPSCSTVGEVLLDGQPVLDKSMDVVELRQRVGMVFQKPNVFPMSIYDNIVIGPKRHGISGKARLDEIAERSLKQVALWDEVKDSLGKSGQELPAGAQQRLCIARAIAVEPDVILMDESCSALDPESTMRIESLMLELVKRYTIIIVTHNMEQARRVSDMSAFMMLNDDKVGSLHEYGPTYDMFAGPLSKVTEDYITGRFG